MIAESEKDFKTPPQKNRVIFLSGMLVLVLALVAVCTLLIANLPHLCESRYEPEQQISLVESKVPANTAPNASDEKIILRVAIAPVISPENSLDDYKELVNYLAKKLNRQGKLLQRGTYAEINELVRHFCCDVAFVCTYALIRGEKAFGMKPFVIPEIEGAITYHSYIIVPASSEVTSLIELRNKRFASADLMSTSGWLYPALWLQGRGEQPESFFSEHMISGSHDRSIQAVFNNYVDGAAVDSLVYDQMARDVPGIDQLRIIQKSPPFGMPPFVIHPETDPQLLKELKNVMLVMHEDPEGKRILDALDIGKFVMPIPGMYDSVKDAVKKWEKR